MSQKSVRVASKVVACMLLAVLIVGSAPLLARNGSESDGPTFNGQPHHQPITHLKRVTLQDSSYYRIFEKAQCTADCGDGTGWQCTGPTVTCVDGVGCTATDGKHRATGTC